jgi:sortase A
MRGRRFVSVTASGLLLFGGLLLGYWMFVTIGTEWFEARAKRHLQPERDARAAPSESHFAGRGRAAPQRHSVIGRIDVPALHVSAVILEGTQARDLRLGAGHIEGTALPGEPGNVGIAAHRDTFFRGLQRAAPNQRITITTAYGAYSYVVESTQIVNPQATSVLAPTPDPILTLVTCYPFYYVGPAPNRFVLRARAIGAGS